ncbi:MAG: hypothetical protein DRR08_18580 [Candidatus Parabeggiatoa sp. nov. 2]|nr:MAG: hypothetical protein B6247_14830 [Beggiatoa sp. 4572_84]RKZ57588.1 MAG: hypothetical protein DRR08_18580 [Gammaproteobacteria bacterium]HEC83670.1 hypothetical protein [Thioploca sp.]
MTRKWLLASFLLLGAFNVFGDEFDYPDLDSYGIDVSGEFFITSAVFQGGISLNDEDFYDDLVEQTRSDYVKVRGLVEPDRDHLEKQADILVVAVYTPLVEDELLSHSLLYMLGENGGVFVWDGQLSSLVAFVKDVTLTESQPVSMYSGKFDFAGLLDIYFGYRLVNNETGGDNNGAIDIQNRDGTIVVCDEPIETFINP